MVHCCSHCRCLAQRHRYLNRHAALLEWAANAVSTKVSSSQISFGFLHKCVLLSQAMQKYAKVGSGIRLYKMKASELMQPYTTTCPLQNRGLGPCEQLPRESVEHTLSTKCCPTRKAGQENTRTHLQNHDRCVRAVLLACHQNSQIWFGL